MQPATRADSKIKQDHLHFPCLNKNLDDVCLQISVNSIVDKCRIPTTLLTLQVHNPELCNNTICSWKTLAFNISVQFLPIWLTQVPVSLVWVWRNSSPCLHFSFWSDLGSVEQKAQCSYWRRTWMQAYSEEGDNSETSGPHLEINDSCTVCKPLVWTL